MSEIQTSTKFVHSSLSKGKFNKMNIQNWVGKYVLGDRISKLINGHTYKIKFGNGGSFFSLEGGGRNAIKILGILDFLRCLQF